MKVKYARSISVASIFFKQNMCKGLKTPAGGVATDATPPAHTAHAICPENIIKPTKALQISQKFYNYAD